VRERAVIATAAIVGIVGLVLWGLLSPSTSPPPAAASTSSPTPSASVSGRSSDSVPSSLKWHSIFDATFPAGSRLNRTTWATCYPWMDVPTGCSILTNDEKQWYLPSQVHVSAGAMALVAKARPTRGLNQQGQPTTYACRSGMVTTFKSAQFKYGYVKVVAKIPKGKGLWPALWLAAANEKWPPEMDMMEHWGTDGVTGVFFHPVGAGQVSAKLPGIFTNGWHTFILDWSRHELNYYVDGKLVLTVNKRIPHQKMYFIADLAYTGVHSKACAGTFKIRRVQIWQRGA
jgi:beta-glucanase (GH16 family)